MEQVDGVTLAAQQERGGAKRRPRWLVWGCVALATAFVALLLAAVLRPATDGPLSAAHRVAPDFSMNLYGGGRLHLKSLRGKTVVLNFWWSGCQPCIDEAPILRQQWQVWKNKGVVFVGVDEIDDPSSAAPRQFLNTYDITYPNGWDPGDVDIQYGTTGQPETFIISPRGVEVYHYAQPFPDGATLAALIEKARA